MTDRDSKPPPFPGPVFQPPPPPTRPEGKVLVLKRFFSVAARSIFAGKSFSSYPPRQRAFPLCFSGTGADPSMDWPRTTVPPPSTLPFLSGPFVIPRFFAPPPSEEPPEFPKYKTRLEPWRMMFLVLAQGTADFGGFDPSGIKRHFAPVFSWKPAIFERKPFPFKDLISESERRRLKRFFRFDVLPYLATFPLRPDLGHAKRPIPTFELPGGKSPELPALFRSQNAACSGFIDPSRKAFSILIPRGRALPIELEGFACVETRTRAKNPRKLRLDLFTGERRFHRWAEIGAVTLLPGKHRFEAAFGAGIRLSNPPSAVFPVSQRLGSFPMEKTLASGICPRSTLVPPPREARQRIPNPVRLPDRIADLIKKSRLSMPPWFFSGTWVDSFSPASFKPLRRLRLNGRFLLGGVKTLPPSLDFTEVLPDRTALRIGRSPRGAARPILGDFEPKPRPWKDRVHFGTVWRIAADFDSWLQRNEFRMILPGSETRLGLIQPSFQGAGPDFGTVFRKRLPVLPAENWRGYRSALLREPQLRGSEKASPPPVKGSQTEALQGRADWKILPTVFPVLPPTSGTSEILLCARFGKPGYSLSFLNDSTRLRQIPEPTVSRRFRPPLDCFRFRPGFWLQKRTSSLREYLCLVEDVLTGFSHYRPEGIRRLPSPHIEYSLPATRMTAVSASAWIASFPPFPQLKGRIPVPAQGRTEFPEPRADAPAPVGRIQTPLNPVPVQIPGRVFSRGELPMHSPPPTLDLAQPGGNFGKAPSQPPQKPFPALETFERPVREEVPILPDFSRVDGEKPPTHKLGIFPFGFEALNFRRFVPVMLSWAVSFDLRTEAFGLAERPRGFSLSRFLRRLPALSLRNPRRWLFTQGNQALDVPPAIPFFRRPYERTPDQFRYPRSRIGGFGPHGMRADKGFFDAFPDERDFRRESSAPTLPIEARIRESAVRHLFQEPYFQAQLTLLTGWSGGQLSLPGVARWEVPPFSFVGDCVDMGQEEMGAPELVFRPAPEPGWSESLPPVSAPPSLLVKEFPEILDFSSGNPPKFFVEPAPKAVDRKGGFSFRFRSLRFPYRPESAMVFLTRNPYVEFPEEPEVMEAMSGLDYRISGIVLPPERGKFFRWEFPFEMDFRPLGLPVSAPRLFRPPALEHAIPRAAVWPLLFPPVGKASRRKQATGLPSVPVSQLSSAPASRRPAGRLSQVFAMGFSSTGSAAKGIFRGLRREPGKMRGPGGIILSLPHLPVLQPIALDPGRMFLDPPHLVPLVFPKDRLEVRFLPMIETPGEERGSAFAVVWSPDPGGDRSFHERLPQVPLSSGWLADSWQPFSLRVSARILWEKAPLPALPQGSPAAAGPTSEGGTSGGLRLTDSKAFGGPAENPSMHCEQLSLEVRIGPVLPPLVFKPASALHPARPMPERNELPIGGAVDRLPALPFFVPPIERGKGLPAVLSSRFPAPRSSGFRSPYLPDWIDIPGGPIRPRNRPGSPPLDVGPLPGEKSGHRGSP